MWGLCYEPCSVRQCFTEPVCSISSLSTHLNICTPEDVQSSAEYRAPSCGSFQSKPAVCKHEISFTGLMDRSQGASAMQSEAAT